jgi:hypothetical protein
LHLELTSLEVDVHPSQRQHLAATKACVSAQEDHEVRARVDRVRGERPPDEPGGSTELKPLSPDRSARRTYRAALRFCSIVTGRVPLGS